MIESDRGKRWGEAESRAVQKKKAESEMKMIFIIRRERRVE
jgi:hypothetical protein